MNTDKFASMYIEHYTVEQLQVKDYVRREFQRYNIKTNEWCHINTDSKMLDELNKLDITFSLDLVNNDELILNVFDIRKHIVWKLVERLNPKAFSQYHLHQ